jgi:HlyD family secretion protein
MKRSRVALVVGIAVVVAGLAFVGFKVRAARPAFTTVAIDRGEIADIVGATGTLQAVTTVQVGSQVSGTIASLGADFNSVVKKGQIIARLDPAVFEARRSQARANLESARASAARSKANIDDTRQKYERAKELAAQSLLPESDLESAKAAYDGATAQHRADQASISQAGAAASQAELDLQHSIISAPIDGVVLARNVDVGQTVAASFQAPTLFVIANDLSRMEVNASVDEADIGQVHVGQDVTFHVDAFPDDVFQGRVHQVRLQPVTEQNVVSYNTIITVDNSSLRLMPGMTATVSIIVDRREDVVRLPSAALRFRPEGFEEPVRGAGPRTGAGGTGGARTGPRPRGEGRSAAGGKRGGRPGLVFELGPDGQPQPTKVRLGLSDGRYVEVVEGLAEGARVVTGIAEGGRTASAAGAAPSSNPFQPQRFRPRSR